MYKDEEDYIRGQLKRNSFQKAKFSNVLIAQLAHFLKERQYNIFQIFDVVEAIETKTLQSKKGIRSFTGKELKGFQYAHWTDARFIAKNLQNFWKIDPRNKEVLRDEGSTKLKQHIENLLIENGVKRGEFIPPEMANKISQTVVNDAYFEKRREGMLTGEWIVFKKIEESNFYYTIAFHTEGDETIKQRLLESKFHD